MEHKLMMKLVVGTEAMFFLCLIMAFVYFSFQPGFRSEQLRDLDIKSTGAFSLLLFLSSITYWRAEKNYNKGSMARFKVWLLLTIVLGAVFLLGQCHEYLKLLHNNVTISRNTFGTSFFTLTGFHGFHVFVGLIILSIITTLAFLGDYDRERSSIVSVAGIYWHFVDIVWLVVFLIVYVSPHLS